jgi:hypothetical protein
MGRGKRKQTRRKQARRKPDAMITALEEVRVEQDDGDDRQPTEDELDDRQPTEDESGDRQHTEDESGDRQHTDDSLCTSEPPASMHELSEHEALAVAREADVSGEIPQEIVEAFRNRRKSSQTIMRVLVTRLNMSLTRLGTRDMEDLPNEQWDIDGPNGRWRVTASEAIKMLTPSLQNEVLPTWFGCLEIDGSLDLSNRGLVALPNSIGNLCVHGDLDLSYNQLNELPPGAAGMVVEGTLRLHHNNLLRLPPDFGRIQVGQTLDLSHNQLQRIPRSLGKLRLRDSLLLSHNQLTKLPSTFGAFALEGNLELQRNALRKLPRSFKDLFVRQTLRLDRNELSGLPIECKDMVVLGEIWLGQNPLETPPPKQLQDHVRLHTAPAGRCCGCLRYWARDAILGASPLTIVLFMLSTFRIGKWGGWRVAKSTTLDVTVSTYVIETMASLAFYNATFRNLDRFFGHVPRAWRRHVFNHLICAHLTLVVELSYGLEFDDVSAYMNYYFITLLNFLLHGVFLMWSNWLVWHETFDPRDSVMVT